MIAHGLVHLLYITPPPNDDKWPFSLTKSWLLKFSPEILKVIGLVLMYVATVGYILFGLIIIFTKEPSAFLLWSGVFASFFSILLMIIFWNNNFVVGILISTVIMGLAIGRLLGYITNIKIF